MHTFLEWEAWLATLDCDDDYGEVLSLFSAPRLGAAYRKRWDSDYLIRLAAREGSFLTEYRLDPASFDPHLDCATRRDESTHD